MTLQRLWKRLKQIVCRHRWVGFGNDGMVRINILKWCIKCGKEDKT